jgi:hypothetical protein
MSTGARPPRRLTRATPRPPPAPSPDSNPPSPTASPPDPDERISISSESSSDDEAEYDPVTAARNVVELRLGFDRSAVDGVAAHLGAVSELNTGQRIARHLPPAAATRRCVRVQLARGNYAAVAMVLKGRAPGTPHFFFSSGDQALGSWGYRADKYPAYCKAARLAWRLADLAAAPTEPTSEAAIRRSERAAAMSRGDLPPRPAPPTRPHRPGTAIADSDIDRRILTDPSVPQRDFERYPLFHFDAEADAFTTLAAIREARTQRHFEQMLLNDARLEREHVAAQVRAEEAAAQQVIADRVAANEAADERRRQAEAAEIARMRTIPGYAAWARGPGMQSYSNVPPPTLRQQKPSSGAPH